MAVGNQICFKEKLHPLEGGGYDLKVCLSVVTSSNQSFIFTFFASKYEEVLDCCHTHLREGLIDPSVYNMIEYLLDDQYADFA